jgi:Putative MetA-pathway of phenol degradation
MKSLITLFIFTSILVLSIGQINAQIVTDRPDQTESSSTVGNGNLQIEAGLLIGFVGEDEYAIRHILAPTTLFRYGITEGIELRLLSQLMSIKIQDQLNQGISDIEIGAKIQIFKREESRFEVAFISHLLVPTGTEGVSIGNFGTINRLAVSQELNETLGLGYNLGYNYLGFGRGHLTYSMVLGVGVNEKVAIYIEPYGKLIDMEEFLLNFDTGLTYLVKDNVQLDFSFGTGLTHKMNYISLGCCWKIEN